MEFQIIQLTKQIVCLVQNYLKLPAQVKSQIVGRSFLSKAAKFRHLQGTVTNKELYQNTSELGLRFLCYITFIVKKYNNDWKSKLAPLVLNTAFHEKYEVQACLLVDKELTN